jgi:hypothetical protein
MLNNKNMLNQVVFIYCGLNFLVRYINFLGFIS